MTARIEGDLPRALVAHDAVSDAPALARRLLKFLHPRRDRGEVKLFQCRRGHHLQAPAGVAHDNERVDGTSRDDRDLVGGILMGDGPQRPRRLLLAAGRAVPHERHERRDGAGLGGVASYATCLSRGYVVCHW